MFKRVRWMGMGALAGVGASAWAQRRLRQTLEQHPSIRTGTDALSAARNLGREVGAALVDGRQAMTEREAALRAELAARRAPSAGPQPGRARARRRAGRGRSVAGGPQLHVVEATSSEPRPAAPAGGPPPGPVVDRHEEVAWIDGRSPRPGR